MAEQEQSLCCCRYQSCCWNIRLILCLHQLRLPLTSVQIFFIHLHIKSSLPFCSFSAILLKMRTPEILEILFLVFSVALGHNSKVCIKVSVSFSLHAIAHSLLCAKVRPLKPDMQLYLSISLPGFICLQLSSEQSKPRQQEPREAPS